MNQLTAYCWANGRIEFGPQVPDGAIFLASGPRGKLRLAVFAIARMSYPSKRGGRDSVPLVPGVPEAKKNSPAASAAAARFSVGLRRRLNSLIHELYSAIERPDIPPAPMARAIFAGDLNGACELMRTCEYDDVTAPQLVEAVTHMRCHIATADISAVLKKWRKR
jgi:hypothetical protein